MVLAHKERTEPRVTQRELARRRFTSEHPWPLPGPGVFAGTNSTATPALLPDGTISPDSLSRLVEPAIPAEPGLGIRPDLEPAVPGRGRTVSGRTTAADGPDLPGTPGPGAVTGTREPRGTVDPVQQTDPTEPDGARR